ncbi:transcriptional regulator, LysR family protein [Roseovarius nubinhibens ISM]|uniref:Transcriptional regulator, LysR family protein n=2 Tax=Roseovarius nubinhibens TaxID=314263 RepID=A3SME4_ROSNI|nr:transcriptional regulator, LysR family protein [Roseovarius nubinhibens ISM]
MDFHINSDMDKSGRNLPSISALAAFERVAQLGNVTRAAEELNTSQAAVSRHIRRLEADLGVALLGRSGRGISLTAAGAVYADEVAQVLARLRRAGETVSANRNELVIACTHEVSHLILMPRYGELRKALGPQAHIRVVTCEYPAIPAMIDAGADIVFHYSRRRPAGLAAQIAVEEILPAAAPDFIAEHGLVDHDDLSRWQHLPRLCLTKANSGWATWQDWFDARSLALPDAPEQQFDNYVYALEAATRGEGTVLAWRGFADGYLRTGQLVPLSAHWVKSGATLYAVASPNGREKKLTHKCIKTLSRLTRPAPIPLAAQADG